MGIFVRGERLLGWMCRCLRGNWKGSRRRMGVDLEDRLWWGFRVRVGSREGERVGCYGCSVRLLPFGCRKLSEDCFSSFRSSGCLVL